MNLLNFAKAVALATALANSAVLAATSGTCSETQRCVSGCCSTSGYCGFGPDFCGDDVCVSDCDAQAECGRESGT